MRPDQASSSTGGVVPTWCGLPVEEENAHCIVRRLTLRAFVTVLFVCNLAVPAVFLKDNLVDHSASARSLILFVTLFNAFAVASFWLPPNILDECLIAVFLLFPFLQYVLLSEPMAAVFGMAMRQKTNADTDAAVLGLIFMIATGPSTVARVAKRRVLLSCIMLASILLNLRPLISRCSWSFVREHMVLCVLPVFVALTIEGAFIWNTRLVRGELERLAKEALQQGETPSRPIGKPTPTGDEASGGGGTPTKHIGNQAKGDVLVQVLGLDGTLLEELTSVEVATLTVDDLFSRMYQCRCLELGDSNLSLAAGGKIFDSAHREAADDLVQDWLRAAGIPGAPPFVVTCVLRRDSPHGRSWSREARCRGGR